MVRKSSEKKVEDKECLFKGEGIVTFQSILNTNEEMYDKGRIFAHTIIKPGCSIGYHVHENEMETYYVLKGTAEFNDNGTIVTVAAGDVLYTPSGCGHGISNNSDEDLEIIVLILFK